MFGQYNFSFRIRYYLWDTLSISELNEFMIVCLSFSVPETNISYIFQFSLLISVYFHLQN
jgi:hypothetical protein